MTRSKKQQVSLEDTPFYHLSLASCFALPAKFF